MHNSSLAPAVLFAGIHLNNSKSVWTPKCVLLVVAPDVEV